MIKPTVFLPAALGIIFLFLSCKTPQDVLDDYNTHFEKVPIVAQDIFDAGNAHLMLNELYKVGIEHTLVLTAPTGCENYSWNITDVGGKNSYLTQTGMRLALYIPETAFYAAVLKADGKSRLYDITLTVNYKGKDYSDTAVLVLYATD